MRRAMGRCGCSRRRGQIPTRAQIVETHAAEPIRTTDLTALAGAPMASLEAAFRTHRGTTSMALLRRKRLELARDRLLLPEPGGTVRNVPHAAGFLRPEQFTAAYAVARAEQEALASRVAALSLREREVCARVARGVLNKQIAAELGISESSVRIYRAEAKRKLGVTSAAELTSLFARLGGIPAGGT